VEYKQASFRSDYYEVDDISMTNNKKRYTKKDTAWCHQWERRGLTSLGRREEEEEEEEGMCSIEIYELNKYVKTH
jgi:hypothetical protein